MHVPLVRNSVHGLIGMSVATSVCFLLRLTLERFLHGKANPTRLIARSMTSALSVKVELFPNRP